MIGEVSGNAAPPAESKTLMRRRKASYPTHTKTVSSRAIAASGTPSSTPKMKNRHEVRPMPPAAPAPKIKKSRTHIGRMAGKSVKRQTRRQPSRIASSTQTRPTT